jgi:penicillin-binding protein 1A
VRPQHRDRVRIANPADGGVFYWLGKLYGFAALVFLAVLAAVLIGTYGYFARSAPDTPDLASYARVAPAVSRMYAADGTLLGEFATEWRELVPFDQIPKPLVLAFLAAEDHEFFDHHGIYFKGILRAVWRNHSAGDFEQGGSTITQQVAKQFLGNEKSLTRKAKEAIVARRLEATYSKQAILSLYLNHIYLGGGAYGVRAAARRYFSKRLDELTLAEMATIAGLAQAPSRYSPFAKPERARARRDEILDKMARFGFATADEAAAARGQELGLAPHEEIFGETSPYYAEHVRRDLVRRYGQERLLRGGLRIETAVEPVVDGAAYENVEFGVRKQDKRQGWRGPEASLDGKARDTFIERSAELYGDGPLRHGKRYLGLVIDVAGRGARVQIGRRVFELPLANMKWASKWSASAAADNDVEILSATEALRRGDVVWVSREPDGRGKFRDWLLSGLNPRWQGPREPRGDAERDAPPRLQLEQVPHPQGALFTADHESGYVVAMVGGHDFARSEFNRAVQACRQPGSTYKPIYYSAALDQGYGFDTLLNDIPRAEVDPVTGEVWTPTNLHGVVSNKVTLEYALVFSKNVPSVAIFKQVGAQAVEKWARQLGFTTTIIADKALALGASCTLLDELTRAFAIFARNGRWIDWVYVRRVFDRDGALLEDNTVAYDPQLAPRDRLDRVAATAGVAPRQAIPARAAYLTSKLLRQEVKHGFANVLRQTEINGAGKTGTSSATMDTSFVGYTSRWITAVWLGDDMRVRPLGKQDAAYITVVPLWSRYMVEVTRDHPNAEIPWSVPEGVRPGDRGGTRGEQAASPMPLKWPKKETGGEPAPTEG